MAGGGHHQLRTKRGKLLADVRVAEMVRCQGVHAPKRRSRFPSSRTGIGGRSEGNRDNPVRGNQLKAARTARRQGGRSRNSAVREQAGRHENPIHAKEAVQRGRKLGVADETRRQTSDGEGRLHY